MNCRRQRWGALSRSTRLVVDIGQPTLSTFREPIRGVSAPWARRITGALAVAYSYWVSSSRPPRVEIAATRALSASPVEGRPPSESRSSSGPTAESPPKQPNRPHYALLPYLTPYTGNSGLNYPWCVSVDRFIVSLEQNLSQLVEVEAVQELQGSHHIDCKPVV